MNCEYDVTAIITGHNEGALFGVSLRSFVEACNSAENAGHKVEKIIVLDRPDDSTDSLVSHLDLENARVIRTNFGDQGLVRNHAASAALGEFLAFLDGDDLWSFNWLTLGLRSLGENPEAIVHPEYNWLFDGSRRLLIKTPSTVASFDKEFLRYGNYWDAMCIAKTEIYRRFPYSERRINLGYAFEDWHWNCVTIANGYKHVLAPDTIHFKRRRAVSQHTTALAAKVAIAPADLLLF